jgi:HEAT repeat protein
MTTKNDTDYGALVERLADKKTRWPAYVALNKAGPAALEAATDGLSHDDWQVRRWCAIYLDHNADERALKRLILTLEDPKAKVRRWAVHSIACEPCKEGELPMDVVPLLAKRLKEDKSIKVRRAAALSLLQWATEKRVRRLLKRIVDTEDDRKIRRYANWGLRRPEMFDRRAGEWSGEEDAES